MLGCKNYLCVILCIIFSPAHVTRIKKCMGRKHIQLADTLPQNKCLKSTVNRKELSYIFTQITFSGKPS